MAAMIVIEGQQGFKVESAASTMIALRMAGFEKSYTANGSQRWTAAGKPQVLIHELNVRPGRAYTSEASGFSTAFECPVIGCDRDHR